jgi:hypothetical protein
MSIPGVHRRFTRRFWIKLAAMSVALTAFCTVVLGLARMIRTARNAAYASATT